MYRTSTHGSLIFDATTTSKWKLGLLGSEVEVADISSAQTISGKTLSSILQLTVDNVDINGNTISTTDTNGNLILTPNGTGRVTTSKDVDLTMSGDQNIRMNTTSSQAGIQKTYASDTIQFYNGASSEVRLTVKKTGVIQFNNYGSGIAHFDASGNISSSAIVNADISASAAIQFSKLEALTSANILVGNGSNVATSVTVTGDIGITNTGLTSISSGVIVNGDVNASAAIAGTKISPDFGSQNITTSGSISATGSSGNVGFGTSADGATARLFVRQNSASVPIGVIIQDSTDSATTLNQFEFRTAQATGNATKRFWAGIINQGVTPDVKARVDTDGTFRSDSTYETSGADYAEFMEWMDANPSNEDRAGYSVIIDSGKIRKALDGETPDGVITTRATMKGNSYMAWPRKYMKDDFGRRLKDEQGNHILNPDYDPDQEYALRSERKEWGVVGLIGQILLRTGQPVDTRWKKIRDVSVGIEEWLVR